MRTEKHCTVDYNLIIGNSSVLCQFFYQRHTYNIYCSTYQQLLEVLSMQLPFFKKQHYVKLKVSTFTQAGAQTNEKHFCAGCLTSRSELTNCSATSGYIISDPLTTDKSIVFGVDCRTSITRFIFSASKKRGIILFYCLDWGQNQPCLNTWPGQG